METEAQSTTSATAAKPEETTPAPAAVQPEVEVFLRLVVTIALVDNKLYQDVRLCSDLLVPNANIDLKLMSTGCILLSRNDQEPSELRPTYSEPSCGESVLLLFTCSRTLRSSC